MYTKWLWNDYNCCVLLQDYKSTHNDYKMTIHVHKMNINDYNVQNDYEMTINVQKVITNRPYKYTKWQYHDDKSTQNENRTSINLHKRNLQYFMCS